MRLPYKLPTGVYTGNHIISGHLQCNSLECVMSGMSAGAGPQSPLTWSVCGIACHVRGH